jgi:hypothetical protein
MLVNVLFNLFFSLDYLTFIKILFISFYQSMINTQKILFYHLRV